MWCLDPSNSPAAIATLRPHWQPPAGDVLWVGEGWRSIVLDCHMAVSARFPDYEILNVKQKWGELAFQAVPRRRTDGPASWTKEDVIELDVIIEPYVARSRIVCEWCGSSGRLRDDRSDEYTLCDACDARFSDPPRPGHD